VKYTCSFLLSWFTLEQYFSGFYKQQNDRVPYTEIPAFLGEQQKLNVTKTDENYEQLWQRRTVLSIPVISILNITDQLNI
jgi:hypothetical protein